VFVKDDEEKVRWYKTLVISNMLMHEFEPANLMSVSFSAKLIKNNVNVRTTSNRRVNER